MYNIKEGVIFDCKLGEYLDMPALGIKEEFNALVTNPEYFGIQGVLCVTRTGVITTPAILRGGTFYSLDGYLRAAAEESIKMGYANSSSAYNMQFNSFISSNKPVLAMLNDAYLVVSFKAKINRKTLVWERRSTLDLYQIVKVVDIPASLAGKDKDGKQKKGVLCQRVVPQSRSKVLSSDITQVVTDKVYALYANKFMRSLNFYLSSGSSSSRRFFIYNRLQNLCV